uniref:Ionotropic glutamate receptor L-glutamate and glycine-binding domain-containing protein n=1 Tax=Anopheles quadriannulatus TaxID=34691 RepID=A0A182X0T2_ANOQN
MKVSVVLCVLFLHRVVLISGGGLQPIRNEAKTPLGSFLHDVMKGHLGYSAGGACFFGSLSTVEWQATNPRVVRHCSGVEACLGMHSTEETKCAMIVVVVKASFFSVDFYLILLLMCHHLVLPVQGRVYHQMLQLSRVAHWSSRAVHIFVWQDTMPLENETQLASSLLSLGIVRVLLLHLNTRTKAIKISFPILFERRSIPADPPTALQLLSQFNQLANVHRYPHKTLYYVRIPYLYRYDRVFGGPDYKFLQTVLERQNATHSWFFHQSDDARFNTFDLNVVDRKQLAARRVTFSLNRLLPTDPTTMEKLYLNTFDGMCVLVPRKLLQTFILKLWQPFSQYLWYTVIAILLAAIIGNLTMPRLFAVNYILALLFGSKSDDYRLKAFDRAILFTLDVLLFLLKEAYTAKIITYMIQTQYEAELDTLAQLALGGPPLLLTPGDYERLNESFRTITGLRIVLRTDFSSLTTDWRDYFRPDYAHAIPCSYGRALVSSHAMHESDAPKFYLLREKLLIQPEAFSFPRNSPFTGRLSFFAACLWESGIFGSWLSDDYYTQDRTPTLDEVLKFENLASLFYVLLVGLAAALVVFGAEQLVALVRMRIGNGRRR